MAELSDEASPHRRATWVALRTLHQRPTVIGRTADGETVFKVRSVRLVLRGDSPHFNRLAECSKCGRDVPGAPVLGPADLDQPSHPVICKSCVRSAPMPSWKPAPAPADAVSHPVEVVAAEPGDDSRLKAVEAQLREVVTQLVAMADVQRSQGAAADATSAALTEVRAEVHALRALAEAGASRVHVLERKQASLQRLNRLLGAQAGGRQVAGEGGAASVRQATAGDLLDTLDRQLLEAEGRLAERANRRLR